MSGSLFGGGFGSDPLTQGLLGLASGFGQAAGPSRMPISLGAAFGSAAAGMNEAMTNAQKLRLLMQQEKRLDAQTGLAEQELAIKRRQFDMQQQLIGSSGNIVGQMSGMGGAPASDGQPTPSTPPANAQEFVQRYAPLAMAASRETGIDPRLILAQAGLESAWGTKAPGNNLFGVKGQGQTLATQESVNGQMQPTQANFRAYDSPEASFRDYAAFINGNPRYGAVKGAQGLEAQIDAMGRSGYATDPNYGGKLRMLARGIQLPEGAQAAQWQQSQPAAAPQLPAPMQRQMDNSLARYWGGMNMALKYEAAGMGGVANVIKSMAQFAAEQGAWVPQRDAQGRDYVVNRITGEPRYAPQVQLQERYGGDGRRSFHPTGDPIHAQPSYAPPMAPVAVQQGGNVNMVEPNSQRVIGQKPLSLEEQSAAAIQSGQSGVTPSQASAAGAGAKTGAENAATNAVKQYSTMTEAAGRAARQNLQLDRAIQAMESFPPGPVADWKISAGRWLSVLGVEPKNTSEGEILKSIQSALQIGQVTGEGQVSNFERQILAERAPILFSTPDGARKVAEYLRALNQYDIDAANHVKAAVGPSGAPDARRFGDLLMEFRSQRPPPPVPEATGTAKHSGQAAPPRGSLSGLIEGRTGTINGRRGVVRNGVFVDVQTGERLQ